MDRMKPDDEPYISCYTSPSPNFDDKEIIHSNLDNSNIRKDVKKAPNEGFSLPLNGAFTEITGDNDSDNNNVIKVNKTNYKVDVEVNMSNDEEAFINGFNHLSNLMSNVSGANHLILEQIQKYILEKYPDMQNKLDLVKNKLQQLQEIIESKNPKISDNIGQSVNETPDSLTKPLVWDDLLEVATPFLDVAKNRSERRMAELDCDLINEELQSFDFTNSSITQQPVKKLIKVGPPNSWHYSTLNNYNNSDLPKSIIKTNIVRTMRDNEMRLRDPSGQYKNFGSWKERMRAWVEDKIIKEVSERNLPGKESWSN
jgi:hypothetical protein